MLRTVFCLAAFPWRYPRKTRKIEWPKKKLFKKLARSQKNKQKKPKVAATDFSKDAGGYNEPKNAPGGRVPNTEATGTPK